MRDFTDLFKRHRILSEDYAPFGKLIDAGKIDNEAFGDRLITLRNYRQCINDLFWLISGADVRQCSDAQLVGPILAHGDDAAFDELYSRYAGPLRTHVARKLCGRDDLLDDVMQLTCIKTIENLETYESDKPFRGWFLTIGANAARSMLRYQKCRRTLSLDFQHEDDDPRAIQVADDSTESGEQKLAKEDALSDMRKALGLLNDSHRKMVELVYIDGLTQVETAEKLGVPLNTVKSAIRRSLETMREHLKSA